MPPSSERSERRWWFFTIFFNTYPMPQQKGFRKSMEHTGKLIDKGWNILIYPEGARSLTGKIASFKEGIGMLALEMRIPVVPVKIEGMIEVLPAWTYHPKFGAAKVKFGKPIVLKEGSYLQATETIEKAVKSL